MMTEGGAKAGFAYGAKVARAGPACIGNTQP